MEATQRQEIGHRLLAFVRSTLLADPNSAVGLDTPLVSSGLVDSFDLVALLSEVERLFGKSLPSGQVSPQDLDSIDRILSLIDRFEQTP